MRYSGLSSAALSARGLYCSLIFNERVIAFLMPPEIHLRVISRNCVNGIFVFLPVVALIGGTDPGSHSGTDPSATWVDSAVDVSGVTFDGVELSTSTMSVSQPRREDTKKLYALPRAHLSADAIGHFHRVAERLLGRLFATTPLIISVASLA